MIAFYVMGTTDLQDMMPVILTGLKRDKKVWVCFIDSLTKKRQFHYYNSAELKNFVIDTCRKNDLKEPTVDFYGINDKQKFESKYKNLRPDFVFIQNAIHKNIAWYPRADFSKVIHFAWHMDSARNITDTHYDIMMNLVKHEKDLVYYGVRGIEKIPDWVRVPERKKTKLQKIDSRYFGNLRTESLRFIKHLNFSESQFMNKKICFVVEAHLRKSDKELNRSTVSLVMRLLEVLRDEGFYTVWKKREKGFPKGEWFSPLDVCDAKPDMVIEKDLNFPSAISYFPSISHTNIVVNTSTAIFDVQDINKNTVMLHPEIISERESRVFRNRYFPYGGFYHVKNDWKKFRDILRMKKDETVSEQEKPSELLLDYLESV